MPEPPTPYVPGYYVPKPLPPEDWPSIDHIITEDGAPVDGVFSEKQMRLLTHPLYASWKTDKTFVAFANIGLFYGVDIQPIVPDVLLSVNVRLPESVFPKINRSYFVWKYGKPPEVVIEIVSNREGGEDTSKLEIYTDVRVSNYVIYDPEGHLSDNPLRLFRLQQDQLVEDLNQPFTFPNLDLGLKIWNGAFELTDSAWLRWTDTQGNLILTGEEVANMERLRADELGAAAAKERGRANELLREQQRLYELCRKHGIDPTITD
jgi:Uma2 family endonuclease